MLDWYDIQGNILRGYRRHRYARFMPFHLRSPDGGRNFLRELGPLITRGHWGGDRPKATTNVALSFTGLAALDLPFESLATFPAEFQEGMRSRAKRLGDTGESDPQRWHPPWNADRVDLVVMVYGESPNDRQARCDHVSAIAATINTNAGSTQIDALRDQDAAWLIVNGTLSRKEHFGFLDGISNPDIEGVPDNGRREDVGNPDAEGNFRKIPVGEFLLGYPGEGGEVAPMPLPHELARNGSYLVIRKLEQDVPRFRQFLERRSKSLTNVPGGNAKEYLAAKMMGRWRDGSPIAVYSQPSGRPENRFKYRHDMAGAACPLGAHIRRANPRDSLGFGGLTVRRRRIIRRGIPYGSYLPESSRDETANQHAPVSEDASGDRGIMFLALNSGFDQFEFVQQTWLNHGDDFHQGNDMDPIVGSANRRRMMIPGDQPIPGEQARGRRPFLCSGIPNFVYTRGGGYFFVPSLTALQLIATAQVCVA